MWKSKRRKLLELIWKAQNLDLGSHRTLLIERLEMAVDDANAGEEGLAFESLCDNLYEFGVSISEEFLQQIEAVGPAFGVQPEQYSYIRELVAQERRDI